MRQERPRPDSGVSPRRYSFARYLAAKTSVDDRALNAHVWQALAEAASALTAEPPPQVLELGAGIGTMAERLLARKVLSSFHYLGIERQPALVRSASRRLKAWGRTNGFAIQEQPAGLLLRRGLDEARLAFTAGDALVEAPCRQASADLLMAHAFLDLVDLPSALPALLGTLRPEGFFHFSLNFDGVTAFEPAIDPALDETIERLYHRTMDERRIDGRPSGDSRTGRQLLGVLPSLGAEVLAAGASDWVVAPAGGRYAHDEAYFLHAIIHTLDGALRRHPELDRRAFARWIERRHRQVERAELVYIAHQLDVFGRVGAPRARRGAPRRR